MKKIVIVSIFIISFLCFPNIINAENKINDMDISVSIDSEGNANVIEKWKVSVDGGDSICKPFTNIPGYKFLEYSVDDETKRYTALERWKLDSNEDYSASSGIYYDDAGVRLCFGINKTGNREYTVKYHIRNFVLQFYDTEGIYFRFIAPNSEVQVENFSLSITSDTNMNNPQAWGYGFDGNKPNVKDNTITTSGTVKNKDEYVSILVKFSSKIFEAIHWEYKDFDELHEEVRITENENAISFEDIKIYIYIAIIFLVVVLLLIFMGSHFKKKEELKKSLTKSVEIPKEFELPNINTLEESNTNNCKNIYRFYYLIKNYGINTNRSSIIGAILVKWLVNDKINIDVDKSLKLEASSVNYKIDFNNVKTENSEEESLLEMLVNASDNGIIQAFNFRKWCSKNYYVIEEFLKRIDSKEKEMFNLNDFEEFPKTKYKSELTNILKFKKYLLNTDNKEDIKNNLQYAFILNDTYFLADKLEDETIDSYILNIINDFASNMVSLAIDSHINTEGKVKRTEENK